MLVATWTSETTWGSGVSVVISQPAAALYIQVPTFATTVAVHRIENVACWNGLHGDAPGAGAAGEVFFSGSAMRNDPCCLGRARVVDALVSQGRAYRTPPGENPAAPCAPLHRSVIPGKVGHPRSVS
jgi:hypothetical protein